MPDESSRVNVQDLDALLQDMQTGPTPRQATEPSGAKAPGQDKHEVERLATNGELKRQNKALKDVASDADARAKRQTGIAKGLAWLCLGLLALNGVTFLYVKTQERRSLEKAFRLIDGRERKFLMGNIMVLDQFAAGLDSIAANVVGMNGIDDEERKYRVKTIQAVKEQNAMLSQMYRTRLQEAETEHNRGPEFSYRDPFLKKEIDMSDSQGGVIDMQALSKEISQTYDLDGTLKSLKDSMVSVTPLADQLRESAEKRKAMANAQGLSPRSQKNEPGDPRSLPAAPATDQTFGGLYGGAPAPGSPYATRPGNQGAPSGQQ